MYDAQLAGFLIPQAEIESDSSGESMKSYPLDMRIPEMMSLYNIMKGTCLVVSH